MFVEAVCLLPIVRTDFSLARIFRGAFGDSGTNACSGASADGTPQRGSGGGIFAAVSDDPDFEYLMHRFHHRREDSARRRGEKKVSKIKRSPLAQRLADPSWPFAAWDVRCGSR